LCFTTDVYFFLFISPLHLQAHSADRHETLTHDRHLAALYNPSPKIRGCPLKNFGAKNMRNLIAYISGMRQDIQNRKDMWSRVISRAFSETRPVNFDPLSI